MTRWSKFRPELADQRWDAVVIGSGIGGLASAALLARHGRRVLVLEQHFVAGGLTHTFRRGAFEWDVGLHYLGKVGDPELPVRRAFDYVTGGAIGWRSLGRVYDRIDLGGERHELVAGAGNFVDGLAERFPAQRDNLWRYVARIRRVARRAERFFAQRIVPRPLAPLTWPLLALPLGRDARRTTAAVMRELFDDPQLIAVLTGRWGNYGLPPAQSSFAMHALAAEVYLDGASYPVGGAAAIAPAIAHVIEAAGGQVAVRAPVASIVHDGRRVRGVRLASGEEIAAPLVLSSAGAHATLQLAGLRDRRARRLARLPPSTGHVALYLGLRGTAAELGVDGANLWLHAGADHDGNLARYLADPAAPLPVVFVASPSAKLGAGASTLTAIAPARAGDFARWQDSRWRRRGAGYEAHKRRLEDQLLARLRDVLPGLDDRIAHRELSTPLSTEHFTGRAGGAMYGLAHGPQRFREGALAPALPVENLYLVGQDVITVGVGAALMSALLVCSRVLRRNLFSAISREDSALLPSPSYPGVSS